MRDIFKSLKKLSQKMTKVSVKEAKIMTGESYKDKR